MNLQNTSPAILAFKQNYHIWMSAGLNNSQRIQRTRYCAICPYKLLLCSVLPKITPSPLLLGLRLMTYNICMQVRKQQLELDMEQQTGSK